MRAREIIDRVGMWAKAVVALAVPGVALMVPALASAADPTGAQYEDTAEQVSSSVASGTDGGAAGNDPLVGGPLDDRVVDALPFTGLDVVTVVAVALVLIATGFVLRRLSASPGS